MSFLAPLGFLFAAALPVIVVLYMLRLRRVRREVSSTLLWRRAIDDMQANAPFQKLRRNLLLLLQLLVAALLVLALAKPHLLVRAGGARQTVLMLDQSASMGATDATGGATRLDAARASALRFVRDMAPSDQAMVLAFADQPRVVCPFTADRQRLERALADVRPTELPTRAADAFALAQSLAQPARAQLALFSDGAVNADEVRLPEGMKCLFFPVGERARNAGIVAVDVRRQPEAPDRFEVFAMVKNYSDQPLVSRLQVHNNGRLREVRDVRCDAGGGEAPLLFSSAQFEPGRLELRLEADDDLPADNSAFVVIAPPRQREVALVTTGNYFLEHALQQDVAHNIALTRLTPGAPLPEPPPDLIVFDGTAPAGPLPPGNYLFINAVPPLPGFTRTGEEENPIMYDWDTQHAAMRYVELGDVAIRRATRLALPAATHVLAESRETPLMVAYSAGDRNALVWTFDLFESNLPLRAAFPILVTNALDWLLRDSAENDNATVATGGVLRVEAPVGFQRGIMTDPAGREWALVPGAGGRLLFDLTGKAGFYRAAMTGAGGASQEDFAASLVNAGESDVTPRQTLQFATGPVASTASGGRVNREVWRWLVGAGLVLLLVEWLVHHRRVWV